MESLDYIDSYFKGELDPSDVATFEQKIISDPAFAEQVATYLSMLQVAKEESDDNKKNKFRELYNQHKASPSTSTIKRMWPSIAVAALVAGIIFGLYVFVKPVSASQFADRYIREQLQTMSVSMGTQDSMQATINLYNQEKLLEALKGFQDILQKDPSNFQAAQNAGITSLRLQRYNEALDYFKQMEAHKELYSNSAIFYQAITLMKRNDPGDSQKAKALLQQIVHDNLSGKEFAQEWLKKM